VLQEARVYCPNCGTFNDDNNFRCVQCGNILQQAGPVMGGGYGGGYQQPAFIPNYLVQAILTTLFCCLPLGIVGIVYAAQVNGKNGAGDVEGAMAASQNAKLWSSISFGLGLAFLVFNVILQVAT